MRVLIYNPRTTKYFKTVKEWLRSPQEAAHFEDIDQALEFLTDFENPDELELELQVNPGQPPARVPLRDYIKKG